MIKRREYSAALLGILVALILWVTILSREKIEGTTTAYTLFHALLSFMRDIQHGRFGVNFLGNIAMFVPVGVLLPLVTMKQKWFWSVGLGFCFSLLIEITQLITARGCFDPDDIILNSLGTAIGYGVYRAVFQKKTIDAEIN